MMERTKTTAFECGAEMSPTVVTTTVLTKGSLATELRASDDCDTTKKTEMAARLPPLDLRGLERKDSSSTSSSSSSAPIEDSDASSSELDDEEVRPYGDDSSPSPGDFLVKPMSMLPVCPFDDLAVEDEKRRRRNVRLMKKDKNNRTHCPDAESLPSPINKRSPVPRRFTPTLVATGTDVARPPLSAPLLRRDSMAIRQQYWKQLGLSMSRRDLERNTSARRERHVGLKVSLNDARSQKGESRSIFQIIAGWYAPNDVAATVPASKPQTGATSGTESSCSAVSQPRKSLRFAEEAELFYIPLHKDYSKRQRDCMWHSRHEFVSMVERNLEQVYDEMEREYDEQLQAEVAENEAMAREEARQRAHEEQLRVKVEKEKAKAAAAAASAAAALALSPSPRRSPHSSPISSPPMLALCPIATQVKVTPRARSTHDIRFKYLKHLGINN